jgi:hypothetical protein
MFMQTEKGKAARINQHNVRTIGVLLVRIAQTGIDQQGATEMTKISAAAQP